MEHSEQGASLGAHEKLARLRLIRTENIGPITFFRLLEQYGSARQALDALPQLARNGGRTRALKICPASVAEDEIAKIQHLGAAMVFWGDPEYPPLLAHIEDPPPVLFVRGHTHLLAKKAVALVGSRNASVNGRRFAHGMAERLGDAGYLVVSGMALEQGREVFSVPGPPQDPRVKGSNALIRDGAYLTENADDVLQVLSEMSANAFSEGRRRAVAGRTPSGNPALDKSIIDKARGGILDSLDYSPTDIDDIIRATGETAAVVAVVLLELEIAGRLERQAGNKVALIAE